MVNAAALTIMNNLKEKEEGPLKIRDKNKTQKYQMTKKDKRAKECRKD